MKEKYVTLTIVPSSSLLANAKCQELEKLGVKNYVICDRKGRGLAIRVLKRDFSKLGVYYERKKNRLIC